MLPYGDGSESGACQHLHRHGAAGTRYRCVPQLFGQVRTPTIRDAALGQAAVLQAARDQRHERRSSCDSDRGRCAGRHPALLLRRLYADLSPPVVSPAERGARRGQPAGVDDAGFQAREVQAPDNLDRLGRGFARAVSELSKSVVPPAESLSVRIQAACVASPESKRLESDATGDGHGHGARPCGARSTAAELSCGVVPPAIRDTPVSEAAGVDPAGIQSYEPQ